MFGQRRHCDGKSSCTSTVVAPKMCTWIDHQEAGYSDTSRPYMMSSRRIRHRIRSWVHDRTNQGVGVGGGERRGSKREPARKPAKGKLKYTGLPHVRANAKAKKPAAPQSPHVLSPRTPYIQTGERAREWRTQGPRYTPW